jgi:C4-dicarboxylate-specific signal transduction histidine kinase
VRISPETPALRVDRVHLETVLHNLLVNAIEAMAATPRADRAIEITAARRGAAVAIRVCDTGSGVAPEIGARLFQPFATSKPAGMGLGLAISRSLVEAHGGTLALAPATGAGACFELVLPTVDT